MGVEINLRERAEAMTTMLSEPQWKPSRSHVETLRNYMAEGAGEIERLRAALENAEQFLELYINGASSIEDGKHTLSHVSSALAHEQSAPMEGK